jgi:hypothetical protein
MVFRYINHKAAGLNFSCHLITLNGLATIVVVGRLWVNHALFRIKSSWAESQVRSIIKSNVLETHSISTITVMMMEMK